MAFSANYISQRLFGLTGTNVRSVTLAKNNLSLEGVDLISSSLTLLLSILVLSLIVG